MKTGLDTAENEPLKGPKSAVLFNGPDGYWRPLMQFTGRVAQLAALLVLPICAATSAACADASDALRQSAPTSSVLGAFSFSFTFRALYASSPNPPTYPPTPAWRAWLSRQLVAQAVVAGWVLVFFSSFIDWG